MPLLSPVDFGYLVLNNGRSLPTNVLFYLSSITVETDRNLPGLFQLEFCDLDPEAAMTKLAPGTTIEILLRSDADNLKPVIEGTVLGLEPQYRSDGNFRLIVWGCDALYRLQGEAKTRTFLKTTDSAIAALIAKDAGLVPQTTDSQTEQEYVIQANQTDLQFLQQRAQQIGYELFFKLGKLHFQPILSNPAPAPRLELGENLLEFYPRFSLLSQTSEVMVQGWDLYTKQKIAVSSSSGQFPQLGMEKSVRGEAIRNNALATAKRTISDRPVTINTAKQIAQAQLDQSALDLITGEGTCLGNPEIQPGRTIVIDGLKLPGYFQYNFAGKYYVTGATHRFDCAQGYFTDFKVKRNAL